MRVEGKIVLELKEDKRKENEVQNIVKKRKGKRKPGKRKERKEKITKREWRGRAKDITVGAKYRRKKRGERETDGKEKVEGKDS